MMNAALFNDQLPIPQIENAHIKCQEVKCQKCYSRKPRSDRGQKKAVDKLKSES